MGLEAEGAHRGTVRVEAETRASPLGRWLWPSLAAPGVVWLILLFLVPFYAICAVALGRLDPIFVTPIPVWNPAEWDPGTLSTVLAEIFGGGPLQTVMLRTFAYVVSSVLCALVVGYPVAYYVSRHGGRRKGLLLILLIAPFWISYLMRMLAWVNLLQEDGYVNRALLFLQVLDEPRLWLAGSSLTVVLGLVYGYLPFLILPLYAALDRIDESLLEAARDLGASPRRAFFAVTLPLSKQGILAGSVVIMLPMFGDYYTPDLLSGAPRTSMIGNQIDFFIHGTQTGGAKGASLVLVLSLLISVLMLYYLRTVAVSAREARQ
ncbi:MAG TPA: ABC transporter permease [Actinomycetota bacterium]|nr:ABC transporter permease [Actinomycetota bacterium]